MSISHGLLLPCPLVMACYYYHVSWSWPATAMSCYCFVMTQDMLDKVKRTRPSLSWLRLPESAGGGFSAILAAPSHRKKHVLVTQRQQQQGPGLVDATSPWALMLVDTKAKTVRTLGTCDGLLSPQVAGGSRVLTQGQLLEACGVEVMCIMAERRFLQVHPGGVYEGRAVINKCASWRADMRPEAVSNDQQVLLSGLSCSSCSPPPRNMEDAADLIAMLQAAVVLGARGDGGGTSGSASGSA